MDWLPLNWLDPVVANIPKSLIWAEPEIIVGLFATLLYSTYEAVVADPVTLPVIHPVTIKEPVIATPPVKGNYDPATVGISEVNASVPDASFKL